MQADHAVEDEVVFDLQKKREDRARSWSRTSTWTSTKKRTPRTTRRGSKMTRIQISFMFFIKVFFMPGHILFAEKRCGQAFHFCKSAILSILSMFSANVSPHSGES